MCLPKPELFQHHRLILTVENLDPKTKAAHPWIEVCRTYFLPVPRWYAQILLIYDNTITDKKLEKRTFRFLLEYRWPWNRREEFFGQVLGINWIERPAIAVYVPESTHGMEVYDYDDEHPDLLGFDAVVPMG